MQANEWARRLDAEADRLEHLADAGDWEALCATVSGFLALLQPPLPREPAVVRPRLERAQDVVDRLLPAATAARDAVGGDVRKLAKGRKAVSAYR